jgi:hypothetical protein
LFGLDLFEQRRYLGVVAVVNLNGNAMTTSRVDAAGRGIDRKHIVAVGGRAHGATGDVYRCPLLGQRECGTATDAAACAGDDRYFAFK